MNESKELLEATIKGLQEKVNQLSTELTTKQKELEDVNKPEMTEEMYDNIKNLVEDGVNQVHLDDDSIEYSIDVDYDNRISIHGVSLNDTYEFAGSIMQEIDNYYRIVTTDKE